MKLLIFGGSGMVGHTISYYLNEKGHNVQIFSRKNASFPTIIGDIKNFDFITKLIKNENFDFIINAAGILNRDVDSNLSDAILINTYFPHFLVSNTKDLHTRIVHLSTDCVFSGKKGDYLENEFLDGETLYDKTKALGEINDKKNITFRNSLIGPDLNFDGIGLFNWFMKQNSSINGFSDVYWNGITSLELAKAINFYFKNNISGIYHLVNNNPISKLNLIHLFNFHFKNNQININPVSEPKSKKTLLNSRKDFLFKVSDYSKMVIDMKEWILNHKNLYPHYFND
jgi:dTDP-4-dehydrorhamnose reductase